MLGMQRQQISDRANVAIQIAHLEQACIVHHQRARANITLCVVIQIELPVIQKLVPVIRKIVPGPVVCIVTYPHHKNAFEPTA